MWELGLAVRRDCERPVEPSCGFSRALRLPVASQPDRLQAMVV